MTDSGPDLPVDFDVHNLVKFLREIKSNMINFNAFEDVFVELFIVVSHLLHLRFVFEELDPFLKNLRCKSLSVTISLGLTNGTDLCSLFCNVLCEVSLQSFHLLWLHRA